MTVVIADSSPLNYLILIGSVDVLHRLYGAIVVPRQVISELIAPGTPHDVRTWTSDLPDWIDVRDAVIDDDDMTHLDPGERAAIVLAQAEAGALLLIDETAGRIVPGFLGSVPGFRGSEVARFRFRGSGCRGSGVQALMTPLAGRAAGPKIGYSLSFDLPRLG